METWRPFSFGQFPKIQKGGPRPPKSLLATNHTVHVLLNAELITVAAIIRLPLYK